MLNTILKSAGAFYLTLLALPLALPLMSGSATTAVVVMIFGIAAAACNLMLGYAGLLSFAQGTFFGVGSYAAGLLLRSHPGLGLGVLVLCAVAGAVAALIIGMLSIRRKGIYFVMITLAMAQMAFFAALSFPDVTGGENGLLDIPRLSAGLDGVLSESQSQYLVVSVMFFLAFAFLRRVVRSPFGRVLDAVRENETRAQMAGYDVRRLKLLAFVISGSVTALAGALYAIQLRSAPLSNIDLMMSETILIMAILGGKRSLLGAVFGALLMTLMAEQLSQLWPRWQMIVGFVLVVTVLFAPSGIGGVFSQWRASSEKRKASGTHLSSKETA